MKFAIPSLRLQDRIVLFVVVLLATVQLASFLFIRYSIQQTAQTTLREELRVASRVFSRLLEQADRQRLDATSVITLDYGLREAIASRDRPTLLSAMRNHAERIRANGMTIIDLEGKVLADLLDEGQTGRPYAIPGLLQRAETEQRAVGMRVVDGRPFRVLLMPVLAPVPIAWVSTEFAIDNAIARDLQKLASSDVSFILARGEALSLVATTLPPAGQRALLAEAARIAVEGRDGLTVDMEGNPSEALAMPMADAGAVRLLAILQRSHAEHLAPYLALQAALLVIAALALAVTLVGSLRIGRRITRPVSQLASAAREVSRGNYAVQVAAGNDELGELSNAFNSMAAGLAERDRMRDVLGKVASSEVVTQLMLQDVKLGGQELDATVMFTDVRNFTALCENLTPEQSLAFLNRFLTTITAVVDQFGGVVDKYVGDGVMALFGAPVTRSDDAQRAVEAALEIRACMDELRPQLLANGMPAPDIGIGLNTSRVVAGNIGSPSRLNYTVLGDGVNLASRLEGLTKRYLVPIVIGNRTRESVQGIVFRELDKVRVRGKLIAERIWEPLGHEGRMLPGEMRNLERWHAALEKYRGRDFKGAAEGFAALASVRGYERLIAIYQGYLRDAEANPPGPNWDAAFTLFDK